MGGGASKAKKQASPAKAPAPAAPKETKEVAESPAVAPDVTSTPAASEVVPEASAAAANAGTSSKIEELTAQAKVAAEANPDNLCAKTLLEAEVQTWMATLPAAKLDELALCAKSGLDNHDSGLGCYAVDPANYDELAPFFDRVCEGYHHGGGKVHTTNWSLDGVEGLPEDGQLDLQKLGLGKELSMRVRVGRNLTAFPLPGLMTKADRVNFEKTMLKAFDVLKANPDYGGNVFSMTPNDVWSEVTGEAENPNLISADKYQELVDAHVMFKDMAADPYLASAGIASDWPCGRGCYQSADGGFIIWFGEEDQLRIMCMAKGFVLNTVFDRLHTALQAVEAIDGIAFATSTKYGYVTSCPSNLGTGMRASVHVAVPNLTSDGTDAKAKAAAKPLGLSVRGMGGEHTPIGKDGTIDLSPSSRLFITEAEIVTKLYNGIKLLLEKEAEAMPQGEPAPEASAAAANAGTSSKIEELTAQAKVAAEANPDNLCAKTLLEAEVQTWMATLPAAKLDELALCAKSGLDNHDSGLGCYAVDPANYDELAPFFDRVCEGYHHGGGKVHTTNWSLDGVEGLPEDGQLDLQKLGLGKELSMRVRVGRNLTAFPLPGLMTKADRVNFEKTMLKAFDVLKANPDYGGNVFSMTPNDVWSEVTGEAENPNLISADKYQELVDAHVMFKDMAADPYLASAGIASDWPCGRGCYQSADGGFIIWFGEEDQLRIMCMAKGFVLNAVFDRLHTALQAVEAIDGIAFATSTKYGYVTSCPSNLGTGMRASVHVAVPNLTSDGTDAKAKAAAKPLGLSVRGMGGEHTPIGKDGTIDLSPSSRLFITEAEIVTKLYNGIKLLLEKEAEAQE